jgi:hypothetical protein
LLQQAVCIAPVPGNEIRGATETQDIVCT